MNDFWSKRLGTQATGSQVAPSTGYYPAQTPYTQASPPPTFAQGNPKAPSSRSTKSCPECGSGNYTGDPGNSAMMIRCYDCGYNPRFGQQSGAGGLPAGQSAPASAARQVSRTGNYQPQVIVGRIGV